MNIIALTLLVLVVSVVIWFIYELITAPEGWQDESGFHFGKKDK